MMMFRLQSTSSAVAVAVLISFCRAIPVTDSPIAGSTTADIFPPASSMYSLPRFQTNRGLRHFSCKLNWTNELAHHDSYRQL